MRMQYGEAEVARELRRLISEIKDQFPADQPLNIIGIRTRGETLAERITQILRADGYSGIGRGVLDITLYRDDLSEVGPVPMVRPTEINIDINGRPLLLVDDVIFTGRSVRSALDALVDFGRPSVIRLLVLADRGGRELPIQPDFVGFEVKEAARAMRVNVRLAEQDGKDEIVIEPRTAG